MQALTILNLVPFFHNWQDLLIVSHTAVVVPPIGWGSSLYKVNVEHVMPNKINEIMLQSFFFNKFVGKKFFFIIFVAKAFHGFPKV